MTIKRPVSRQPIPEHANCVFEGKLFSVYQWEQELFDGSTTTFEKLRRPDSARIFPVLSDGRILLLREEQPGAGIKFGSVGGRIDPGESPLEAAQRELREETGYTADTFELWRAE